MIQTSRRKLIVGLGSLIAAPAIVRYASIMPVKTISDDVWLPPGSIVYDRGGFWIIINHTERCWYHIEHPDPSTIFPGPQL